MKIAAVSDNGVTISQHFGRASQYVVLDVEDGKIISKETRPKVGHTDFVTAGHHEHHGCGCAPHGYEAGAAEKHGAMSRNILDASVLLAGGMGWGAYESLRGQKIEPIITDVKDIEEAVRLYVEGKLPNLMQRLH
jgi:predicted Fe-Mo cluster-binding NifX family protein